MCPFKAGIFLNFRWHRLHSTGFNSVLAGVAVVVDVPEELVVVVLPAAAPALETVTVAEPVLDLEEVVG